MFIKRIKKRTPRVACCTGASENLYITTNPSMVMLFQRSNSFLLNKLFAFYAESLCYCYVTLVYFIIPQTTRLDAVHKKRYLIDLNSKSVLFIAIAKCVVLIAHCRHELT